MNSLIGANDIETTNINLLHIKIYTQSLQSDWDSYPRILRISIIIMAPQTSEAPTNCHEQPCNRTEPRRLVAQTHDLHSVDWSTPNNSIRFLWMALWQFILGITRNVIPEEAMPLVSWGHDKSFLSILKSFKQHSNFQTFLWMFWRTKQFPFRSPRSWWLNRKSNTTSF
jgi:hypothetical protein